MSSKNTSTCFLRRGCNTWLIKFWNVAGTFVSPKGMTVNSNNPSCVLKVVFSMFSSFILTW